MTSAELIQSFQSAIASMREMRARAALPDLEYEDGPELRADARRFAEKLEQAPDEPTAEALLRADRAGAQAFWHLVQTRWEAMETFLIPSAFELHPNPLPFEPLCRCELWMDETVPPATHLVDAPALCPPEEPGHPTKELEWEQNPHTAGLPGIPRAVREAFESPQVTAEVAGVGKLADEPNASVRNISLKEET